MKPCLQKLKNDPDIDVQFYALESLDGKRETSDYFIHLLRLSYCVSYLTNKRSL